jgi:hypothetical protein
VQETAVLAVGETFVEPVKGSQKGGFPGPGMAHQYIKPSFSRKAWWVKPWQSSDDEEEIAVRFQKIEATIWHDEKFRSLTHSQQLLFLYLLTCPHSNLAGCFVLPTGYACCDLKVAQKDFGKDLATLMEMGLTQYDATANLVLITNFQRYNPITSPTQKKAAVKIIAGLPKSKLLQHFKGLLDTLFEGLDVENATKLRASLGGILTEAHRKVEEGIDTVSMGYPGGVETDPTKCRYRDRQEEEEKKGEGEGEGEGVWGRGNRHTGLSPQLEPFMPSKASAPDSPSATAFSSRKKTKRLKLVEAELYPYQAWADPDCGICGGTGTLQEGTPYRKPCECAHRNGAVDE